MDSILTSIKKDLGLAEEYEVFDPDIIMYINSVFPVLSQLGVGPEGGFRIQDETANWSDYIDDNTNLLGFVKTYIYLKVKLIFDPPASSVLIEAINRTIKETEWRITVEVDSLK